MSNALTIIKGLRHNEIENLDSCFNQIKSLGEVAIYNYDFADVVTEFLDYIGIEYSKQWIIPENAVGNYWLIKKN